MLWLNFCQFCFQDFQLYEYILFNDADTDAGTETHLIFSPPCLELVILDT